MWSERNCPCFKKAASGIEPGLSQLRVRCSTKMPPPPHLCLMKQIFTAVMMSGHLRFHISIFWQVLFLKRKYYGKNVTQVTANIRKFRTCFINTLYNEPSKCRQSQSPYNFFLSGCCCSRGEDLVHQKLKYFHEK